MVGVANAEAAADKIMAFETEIAKASWPIADRRDFSKINNPMTMAELSAYAPQLNWAAFFEGADVPPQKRMIVQENTAIRDIVKLYAATPLETLKAWEKFHIADDASPYLSKRSSTAVSTITKTLSGVTENRPRWKRAVDVGRRQASASWSARLCRAVFPGVVQGQDGRAGRQPEGGDGRPDQGQQLDGARDQGGGARQARAWT